MSYIKRTLEGELKKIAREYPVVALLGPRQSGKTTMVQKVFSKKKYISLENIDNRTFALNDPNKFLNVYENVVIDEAQRTPNLLSYIQTKVDKDKKKGQFILTGSNQLLLEEKITQSLAGRAAIVRLLPLSIEEINPHKNIESIDELIFQGFYPILYSENINKQRWLDNYIETYIDKDVRLIKNITNLSKFNIFLRMCASRVGQLVNLQSLSNDCGISQNSIKSWLSVLESSFIIKRLNPYFKNYRKRLIKTPKIYFYDTGVLCRLLSIKNLNGLATHALKGSIFENFILMEIEKHFFNRAEKTPIYFWRNRGGQEIDFLFEDSCLKIIEVKSSETINNEFFKNIVYFKKNADQKAKAYLIYSGTKSHVRTLAHVLSWKKIEKLFL